MRRKRALWLSKAALALVAVLLVIAGAPLLFAVEESAIGQPSELTEAQFEQMTPEQKADFFRQPQNVVKNIRLAEQYFQEPDAFQRARDGAQEFLRTKHRANYVLDTSAGALTYNAAAGTLRSGTKTLQLVEYQNNPNIREIRAVNNDFIISELRDGQQLTTTLSGDGMGAIQYAHGTFTVKDTSGNAHSLVPEGTARMSISDDGTLTVNGDATGLVKTSGSLCGAEPDCFYTFTLKNTRVKAGDPDPQLVITSTGDIDVVDGEAEVDTPTVFIDGLFTAKGKDVLSYAYYHPETRQTKETVLVDKSTSIGVISAGQAKSKNEYVLTHLDHLVAGPSGNPSFSPGPLLSQQQAQEQVEGLRRQPAPTQPNSAEVHVKNEGTGTRVSSRGKVKLVSYGLGPDGAVFDRDLYDASKPVLTALADGTEMHYLKEGEREWVDIQGEARYEDNQQATDITQKGARLQKNAGVQARDKDVLTLSCGGCSGDAFRISKQVALVNKGGDRYGYQLTSATVDVVYRIENGQLTADTSSVSLNTLAALAESRDTRLAMDKQLYIQVEGQKQFFGIGGNGIGMYQENGEATPVTIVLNSKGVLGEPVPFDPSGTVTGIDPTKLGNERYRTTIQRGLREEDRTESLRQQFKRQFGHDVTVDGTCTGRQKGACQKAIDAGLAQGSELGRAYLNLRKARVAGQKALLEGLALAAADERKTTAVQQLKGIAKSEKSFRAIEQSWAAQRAAAAAAQEQLQAEEAYQKQLKEDKGSSVYLGTKLRDVDASLNIKRTELERARQRFSTAKTSEFTDVLRSISLLEGYVAELEQQRSKLQQEFSETAARHAHNPEALATIYTNGGRVEEAKQVARLLAQRPESSDLGHYLASLACSKGGDAKCALEELGRIQDGQLKQKAAAAKHRGIDVKLARDAFIKAEQARFDAIGAHTEFEHDRDDLPIPSSVRFWWDTDRSRELAAIRVADENAKAAAAVTKLVSGGKNLEEVNRLSNEQIRSLAGTDDLGDINGFRAGTLRYDAILSSGGVLSAQQQYDILMRNAERKVLNAHGDEIVAQEDYAYAIREFGGTGVNIGGAVAAYERIEKDRELNFAGFETGIKTPFSSQQIGRFASDMLDITAPLDFAFVGVKVAVGVVKLAKAAHIASAIRKGLAVVGIGEDVAQAAARADDYYRILNVARDAGAEEIRAAYRGLARVHHPDVGGSVEEFIKISEAYGTLADAGRRAVYNQQVAQRAVETVSRADDLVGVAQQAQRAPSRLGAFLTKERGITQTGRFIGELEQLARAEQAAGNVQEATAILQHIDDFKTLQQADRIYSSRRGGVSWAAKSTRDAADAADIPKNLRSPVARAVWAVSDSLRSARARIAPARGELWKSTLAYQDAKLFGDAAQTSAAAKNLIGAEQKIHLEYYIDGFFRAKTDQIISAAKSAAKTSDAEATLQLERAAQKLITDAGVFAANTDKEITVGQTLLKCTSPCTLTPEGRAILEQADTIPDFVSEYATSIRDAPLSAVDEGLDVMDRARAADAGTDITRVVATDAIDELVGRFEVNPLVGGAARQDALNDAALARSLPNQIAREEGRAMQAFPEVIARQSREIAAADARVVQHNLVPLVSATPDQRGRLTLWVEQDTGEIRALGSFDAAGDVAKEPSVQQIIVSKHPVAGYEMPKIGEALSTRAKRVLEQSLDAHARLPEPDVLASAPPPKGLKVLDELDEVTRPDIQRARRAEQTAVDVGETLPGVSVAPRAGTVPVSSFDYDSLQVMNILGISPDAARSRGTDAVRRIGVAYREEVGLLDAGRETPQLSKLISEGALTSDELGRLRRGAPMAIGGRTQEDLEKILVDFFEKPAKLGEVHGFEGRVSPLYDRVGTRNVDEIFQLNLEKQIGPNIYGGKAVAYVRDDGTIAVAFMTETDKTHHRHALANIIGGEKGNLVYEGTYGDYRIADLPNRAFGIEFQFDKKSGKIIGMQHSSQITTLQFGKGAKGWRLDKNVVDHINQQLLNKIDPELFDESFFNKPINEWINTKELPIASQCL